MRYKAEHGVSCLRFIDETGSPVGELPDFAHDTDDLVALYRAMLLTRAFDEKAVALQRTGLHPHGTMELLLSSGASPLSKPQSLTDAALKSVIKLINIYSGNHLEASTK